jgi:hypothetical protein
MPLAREHAVVAAEGSAVLARHWARFRLALGLSAMLALGSAAPWSGQVVSEAPATLPPPTAVRPAAAPIGQALAPAAPFRVATFAVIRLAPGVRPHDDNPPPSLEPVRGFRDANGVPMSLIDGRLVYKPAGLAQRGVNALNGYRRSGNRAYLEMAREIGRVFLRIARNRTAASTCRTCSTMLCTATRPT